MGLMPAATDHLFGISSKAREWASLLIQGHSHHQVIVLPISPGAERLMGRSGDPDLEALQLADQRSSLRKATRDLDPPGLQDSQQAGDQLFLGHVVGAVRRDRDGLSACDCHRHHTAGGPPKHVQHGTAHSRLIHDQRRADEGVTAGDRGHSRDDVGVRSP
jgi:hypothetical protein